MFGDKNKIDVPTTIEKPQEQSTPPNYTCNNNCIIKNSAYLNYIIDNDPELDKSDYSFATPVQLCVKPPNVKKVVGLKLICQSKAYVGDVLTIKVVAVNEGNTGLTGLYVKDFLPSSLSYQNSATVEVFDQNGTFVPPTGSNIYTVSDTTTGYNVLLTLVKSLSPTTAYTLQPGWFAVFSFKVKVLTKGTIKNSALVGSVGIDEDPSNEVQVIGHILALTISKSIKNSVSGEDYVVQCGDSVTYVLKVTNPAANTLEPTDFTITDMFESEFVYSGIKIYLDNSSTDISNKFNITTPTVANFNTLTITPNTFSGLGPGHYITIEISGTISCCQNC